MSNNNTLLTEISALVLAVLLVIAGALLLYLGKISYDSAIFFFISALGLFGFNSAWKAPSPAQQSQLLSLVSEKQAQPVIIHNNIPATPASVPAVTTPAPAQPFAPNPTPAQLTAPPQQFVSPFPYAPTPTFPEIPAMPTVQP